MNRVYEQEFYRGKDLDAIANDRRCLFKDREEETSELRLQVDHVKHANAKLVAETYEFQN